MAAKVASTAVPAPKKTDTVKTSHLTTQTHTTSSPTATHNTKKSQSSEPSHNESSAVQDKNLAVNTAAVSDSPAQIALNREVSKLCSASSSAPAPSVLKLALTAYNCAVATGTAKPRTLTVIDYSLPSTQKRMWVYDLVKNRLLYNTFTAHGQGSGGVTPDYFSNRAQTHASSLGLFLTEQEYFGHEGLSLRLRGLENGFNDQAESRGIVVHGAPYVSASIARSGRLGRSWGCPAVPQNMAEPIINCIKHGNLVFSYYPDTKWLKHSKFLHCPVPASTLMAAFEAGRSVS